MIRIIKGRAPAILRSKGRAAREEDCAAHDRDPPAFAAGTKRFTFQDALYGAPQVKRALRRAQHDKCCFCESKVTHISFGDVEHFRPKAAYRQKRNGPLIRPGYFWLAYEWINLLFCCEVCNRRGKANLFPLVDSSARATSSGRDIRAEQPRFIHPGIDDPAEHIEFRDERAYPRGNSQRGRITIRELQLNREELRLRRREYLKLLDKIREARQLLIESHERLKATGTVPPPQETERLQQLDAMLAAMVSDSAEYAAMARCFLGKAVSSAGPP